MSDKPLSDDDVIRQQLRASNEKRRQEAQRRAEEIQLQDELEKSIGSLLFAISDVKSLSNYVWSGQPFPTKAHIQPITTQLREALNVLHKTCRLGLLNDIDLDATWTHYCGQNPFDHYSKDDSRKALDFAVMQLKAAAQGRADFDQLVMELFFDSSVEPAGVWFRMLLDMLRGGLRFERKVKPGNPAIHQAGERQAQEDGDDRTGDQGGTERAEGAEAARAAIASEQPTDGMIRPPASAQPNDPVSKLVSPLTYSAMNSGYLLC